MSIIHFSTGNAITTAAKKKADALQMIGQSSKLTVGYGLSAVKRITAAKKPNKRGPKPSGEFDDDQYGEHTMSDSMENDQSEEPITDSNTEPEKAVRVSCH